MAVLQAPRPQPGTLSQDPARSRVGPAGYFGVHGHTQSGEISCSSATKGGGLRLPRLNPSQSVQFVVPLLMKTALKWLEAG
jgi:hypothetical protein